MYRVMAVIFMLSATTAEAGDQLKYFRFGDCSGHETICDDAFNERIVLRLTDDGSISADIEFDHPHIVQISESEIRIEGDHFTSAHLITNNLGHGFMFEISGRVESALAEVVVIHLSEEHLATISLVSFDD